MELLLVNNYRDFWLKEVICVMLLVQCFICLSTQQIFVCQMQWIINIQYNCFNNTLKYYIVQIVQQVFFSEVEIFRNKKGGGKMMIVYLVG